MSLVCNCCSFFLLFYFSCLEREGNGLISKLICPNGLLLRWCPNSPLMITFYLENISLWASQDSYLTGEKTSLLCSGNSVVQPFSLGLNISWAGNKLNKYFLPHFHWVKRSVSHQAWVMLCHIPGRACSASFALWLISWQDCSKTWVGKSGITCGYLKRSAALFMGLCT